MHGTNIELWIILIWQRFMDISNVGLPWELCILFIGYVNMFLPNCTASHTKIINPYIHCLQKNEWLWRKKTYGHTLCQCCNFCLQRLARICACVCHRPFLVYWKRLWLILYEIESDISWLLWCYLYRGNLFAHTLLKATILMNEDQQLLMLHSQLKNKVTWERKRN
jgi:hypothetical protein